MDGKGFDALARGFGGGSTRRRTLQALAGALVGLGSGGRAAARPGAEAATCGQRCQDDGDCNFGFRCGGVSDVCFAIPSSRERCRRNRDCTRTYEVCSDRRCTNERRLNPGRCDECRRNGDCRANERCTNAGRCVRR